MADGTRRPIKDVRIGDEVVTFNPETLETGTTLVVHHFVAPTEKPIVEVKTSTGRKIVVTHDHKMMTERGWVEAGALTLDDRVAIEDKGDVIFVPVASVTEHPNVMIADITTESDFHSFVGGDGFCVHNSSMGKQALGVVHSTLSHRMVNSKAMVNPTRPYSATQTAAMVGMDELPAGANVSIAFMSYSGQNQEDAIYVSEEFANNGGFRYSVSHIFKANDSGGNATSTEYFAHPGASVKKDPSLYHAIDSNGLPRPESTLNTGDCVIGKVRRTVENGKETFRDESVYLTVGVEGRVERVLVANSGGQVVVKVKIRQTRIPVRGDKLASRHAQKSTIGQIISKSEMPFNAITGTTPDIIINDKAIPSRMTIGMLIEVLTSQAAAMLDTRVDATAFRYITQKGGALDDLRRILKLEFGFNDLGNTKMRSGTTGEIFNSRIFTGVVHYQVLRHLAQFKFQARGGTGPTSLATRQPVSGRIRGGGGRFGEMETWALVAHNGSGLLKDKACYSSDPFKAVYCKKCGIKATRRYGDNKYICTGCETQSDEDLGTCTTPYSMRMFGEMLRAAGLNIQYKFEKAKE